MPIPLRGLPLRFRPKRLRGASDLRGEDALDSRLLLRLIVFRLSVVRLRSGDLAFLSI